eukprot:364213-Chlamydomonas_euryale.AAC.1
MHALCCAGALLHACGMPVLAAPLPHFRHNSLHGATPVMCTVLKVVNLQRNAWRGRAGRGQRGEMRQPSQAGGG